jgi:hypothetical protein
VIIKINDQCHEDFANQVDTFYMYITLTGPNQFFFFKGMTQSLGVFYFPFKQYYISYAIFYLFLFFVFKLMPFMAHRYHACKENKNGQIIEII